VQDRMINLLLYGNRSSVFPASGILFKGVCRYIIVTGAYCTGCSRKKPHIKFCTIRHIIALLATKYVATITVYTNHGNFLTAV